MSETPLGQRGFTLLEALISLALLLTAMLAIATMLLQGSRVNRQQQLLATTQSDARTSLSLIVNKLRTAGWDPTSAGIQAVQLDTNLTDGIDTIEVFADLDSDGDTDGLDEQILIRHLADRIEWRRSATGSFEILAAGISNDANGDGTTETMFVPDSTTNPTRIVVQITAESSDLDPLTKTPVQITMASEVALRRRL